MSKLSAAVRAWMNITSNCFMCLQLVIHVLFGHVDPNCSRFVGSGLYMILKGKIIRYVSRTLGDDVSDVCVYPNI